MERKMKLITESNYDLEITESKEDKALYIMGVFSSAEARNKNGRVYPKSLLEREINKIQESISNRSCLGQLGHPVDSPETNLEKAAILTEELVWKGNDVFGKAKVLKTPSGNILKGLIDEGVKVGISSRGLGTVDEDGSVNDSYSLICWDCVHSASNPKSKWVNGVYEGKEFTVYDGEIQKPTEDQVQEVLKEHQKKIWQVLKSFRGE